MLTISRHAEQQFATSAAPSRAKALPVSTQWSPCACHCITCYHFLCHWNPKRAPINYATRQDLPAPEEDPTADRGPRHDTSETSPSLRPFIHMPPPPLPRPPWRSLFPFIRGRPSPGTNDPKHYATRAGPLFGVLIFCIDFSISSTLSKCWRSTLSFLLKPSPKEMAT